MELKNDKTSLWAMEKATILRKSISSLNGLKGELRDTFLEPLLEIFTPCS